MPPALHCRGLVKRYGDVLAVDHLDLQIETGECFGLLGPNGAGKTTTIEILEGLLTADEGEVDVLGLRWDRHERELRERLGIQLQETQFSEKLTVAEIIRLFRSFYRNGRSVDETLALVEEMRAAPDPSSAPFQVSSANTIPSAKGRFWPRNRLEKIGRSQSDRPTP